jgi:hypothetical protein
MQENDTEAIRQCAKGLAFARGFDASYYDQWKKTYPPDEWKTTIEQYLADKIAALTRPREKKRGAARNVPPPNLLAALAPVYIAEGYWDRLMALVKKENSLETALRYHQYLCKQYSKELLEIYLPALRRQGEQASYQPEFARLAATMKKIMADIPQGKVPVKYLAREIIAKHPVRSAYLKELNAVLRIR